MQNPHKVRDEADNAIKAIERLVAALGGSKTPDEILSCHRAVRFIRQSAEAECRKNFVEAYGSK